MTNEQFFALLDEVEYILGRDLLIDSIIKWMGMGDAKDCIVDIINDYNLWDELGE